MKITFEVDENEVLGMLQTYYDDRITMDMTMNLVLKDEGVLANIFMWGYDETETRSTSVNVLTKKFINMWWPLGGDSDSYKKEFQIKWDKAMSENKS